MTLEVVKTNTEVKLAHNEDGEIVMTYNIADNKSLSISADNIDNLKSIIESKIIYTQTQANIRHKNSCFYIFYKECVEAFKNMLSYLENNLAM